MPIECSANEIHFGRAGGRRVVADFDGGMASSNALVDAHIFGVQKMDFISTA
jgi:hypothetical protein